MTITAKFDSKCPECGQQIVAGQKVEWTPGSKAKHIVCVEMYRSEEQYDEPVSNLPSFQCRHNLSNHCTVDGQPLRPAPFDQKTQRDRDDDSYEAWLAFLSLQAQIGAYVMPDGEIIKVQMNRAKTGVYPEVWTQIGGERLTESDKGVHFEFRYIDDPMARAETMKLIHSVARRMTVDEARDFAIRYGRCAVCGRAIKAKQSVERGIGPICWSRLAPSTQETIFADVLVDDDTEDLSERQQMMPRIDRTSRAMRDAQSYVERMYQARRQVIDNQSRSRWTRASDDELEHAAGW